MQSLKSKTQYIILAALLFGMLLHINVVYVVYSVAVSVIFAVIIGVIIAFWYVGKDNPLFMLKYLEALRKKDNLSTYKYQNVVVKLCIAILLFANGYNLTGLMYLTAHGVCYYNLLHSEKALLFRKKVSSLVFNVSDIEDEQTVVYVVVGNIIKSPPIRDLVFGLSDSGTLRASDYGVCLTRNDAEKLRKFLKQDGWLK